MKRKKTLRERAEEWSRKDRRKYLTEPYPEWDENDVCAWLAGHRAAKRGRDK